MRSGLVVHPPTGEPVVLGADHDQQRACDPFCRTHECDLVGNPLRFLRGASVSARAEHLLVQRRQLGQQAAGVIRAAISNARPDAWLAGRSERRVQGAETLPYDPDPTSVNIVAAFQHVDYGANDRSPLVGRRKTKRGLALAGATPRATNAAAQAWGSSLQASSPGSRTATGGCALSGGLRYQPGISAPWKGKVSRCTGGSRLGAPAA